MNPSEIAFLPAVEQTARIRNRELSPVEVIDAALVQYEGSNTVVNAIVMPAYAHAQVLARAAEQTIMRGDEIGPLHGLPIALKDMTETACLHTTYGSLSTRTTSLMSTRCW
jgi:Asp-tRNA(Asn)/Glu-tRNA(Gln) amidotransferase A subunit family amidase